MQMFNWQSGRPVVFKLDDIEQAFYGDRHESITIKVGGNRPQDLTFNRELHGDQQFAKLERKLVARKLL